VFNHRRRARTLLSADSFNRADSTTNLGSTDGVSPNSDGPGILDPLTWTQQRGTWGINTNRAYTSVSTGGAIATVDLLTPDVDITITVRVVSLLGSIIFRFVDTSNYFEFFYRSTGSAFFLRRIQSGSATVLGTTTHTPFVQANDTIRMVAAGSAIACYWNATSLFTATDTFQQTVTKHGLQISADTGARLDDWTAYPA
jgi:hypothetical protein